MSNQTRTLTVVIEERRIGDAEPLMDAIRQMRGVISVNAEVSNFNDYANKELAKHELKMKLWEVLNETSNR